MDVTFFFDKSNHLIQPVVNKLGSFDSLEDLSFTMDFAFVISKEDYQMF